MITKVLLLHRQIAFPYYNIVTHRWVTAEFFRIRKGCFYLLECTSRCVWALKIFLVLCLLFSDFVRETTRRSMGTQGGNDSEITQWPLFVPYKKKNCLTGHRISQHKTYNHIRCFKMRIMSLSPGSEVRKMNLSYAGLPFLLFFNFFQQTSHANRNLGVISICCNPLLASLRGL